MHTTRGSGGITDWTVDCSVVSVTVRNRQTDDMPMKRRLVDDETVQSFAQQQQSYDPCKRFFLGWDASLDDDDDNDNDAPHDSPHGPNGFAHPMLVDDDDRDGDHQGHEAVEVPLVFVHDGPPSGLLLAGAADMALVWTPLGSANENQQVHCMFCKTGMKRRNWPAHMKRKHAQAMRECPFAYCSATSESAHAGREHILKYHDVRGYRCKDCPDLIFDRRATQWKHQCQTHLNWAPNAFHVDIGEDPLHEDDPGGTRGERIFYGDSYGDDDGDGDGDGDDNMIPGEEEEHTGSGDQTKRGSYGRQSSFSRTGGTGGAASRAAPKGGSVGSSRLGSCISGLVPW